MPRHKLRCRKCGQEYNRNIISDMSCRKCQGLLIKVDSHLDRRIEKARKDFVSDIVDYAYQSKKL